MDELLPGPDQIDGAPHPREAARVIGQGGAERVFLESVNSGRLHHAWLLVGPKGVGKATLAWAVARFLLTQPVDADPTGLFGAQEVPESLYVSSEHPVARRIAAGSEPGLLSIARPWDEKRERYRAEITVEEVRRLRGFFGLTATDGGRRVVIIDAADELNASAANALLKVLEEPPRDAVLLLIAHQPSRLLPTIRSRCRTLRLGRLGETEMAEVFAAAGMSLAPGLAALADGSAGAAMRLALLDGLSLYESLLSLFSKLPQLNRSEIGKLAEGAAARGAGAAERYDLLLELFELFLARVAVSGASGRAPRAAANGEASLLDRLAPGPAAARGWADLAQALSARARHAQAVNLDPAGLVLDMCLQIEALAAKVSRP